MVVVAFVMACGAVWQLSGYMAANHTDHFEKVVYTWLGTDSGALTFAGRSGPVPFHVDDTGHIVCTPFEETSP